jgi:hypothetical protein
MASTGTEWSTRDELAARFLQAIITGKRADDPIRLAIKAYQIADALLTARLTIPPGPRSAETAPES